jgi:hypothetical protein
LTDDFLIPVAKRRLLCSFEGPRGLSPFSGGYGEGETPLPIPNRAVKPLSADGTWPARARESRTPPVFSHHRWAARWAAHRAFCVAAPRAPAPCGAAIGTVHAAGRAGTAPSRRTRTCVSARRWGWVRAMWRSCSGAPARGSTTRGGICASLRRRGAGAALRGASSSSAKAFTSAAARRRPAVQRGR